MNSIASNVSSTSNTQIEGTTTPFFAIAFVPTVVEVRDARRVGDRIYIQLLNADEDGAAIVKALSGGNTDEL